MTRQWMGGRNRRNHIAITVAGLAVWIVFVDALFFAFGQDLVALWMLEIYRSGRADGSLIWWWLAIVVTESCHSWAMRAPRRPNRPFQPASFQQPAAANALDFDR